ncbi:MAG: FkbM family methyltransferase [Deltaproteobacteria bacterium]|nr:FkbM family methyltransferase [Deltaproteobacteria bacterium]
MRLHGVWLEVPADASAAHRREVYAERYERGEARCVLLRLDADDVVMEVGAGVGFVSTLCALRVGSERVTCYEANPALLPRIRETFAANGVSPALVHGVLAREAGEAELFVEREFVSSSLRERSGEARAVRVPRLAVNEELRRVRPTCLVIDIEGGESELLPAIDWTGVRKLVLEVHPHVIGEARVRELIALIEAEGFREERGVSSTRKKFFARASVSARR